MLVDIIGHIANFIYLVGSSFKEQIYLRASFVLAAIFELYYSFNQNEPLWTIIIWSGGFLFFNTYYLTKFILEKKNLNLSSVEEIIYYKSFSKIDKLNFKRILKLSTIEKVNANVNIINKNEPTKYLYLIVEGLASIRNNNKILTYTRDGSFIGEMSYLTGDLPSATVHSETNMTLLKWDKDKINKIFKNDYDLESKFKTVLSDDLVSKIYKLNNKII